ncbi:MAG: dicarboxylate/amino acid:cation symporter [Phycicoccus sp.]
MSSSADTVSTAAPRRRSRVPFWAQVLVGLVLGALLGWAARTWSLDGLTTTLDVVGSAFVSLLRTVVVPLVFLAIVVSVARLREVNDAARLAARTLLWFAVTAAIAVTIGIVIGLVTDPGLRTTVDRATAQAPERTGSWTDFLQGVVPSNFLGLEGSTGDDGVVALEFNVLQIVVLALLVGAAVLRTGTRAEPFVTFAESLLGVIQTVLWWIIRLSPIGTLGLIGTAVATYGWDLLAPLAVFTADVYLGCALVLFGVYPLLLRAHGLSPAKFFSGAWPALQLAFVSRSSVGTMPVTQYVTTRNLGVPREYASFAVPLGATTKMDGCAAVYPALAAIFVAQFFGVELGVTDYLLIAFVSVVGSAATAGLTGAVVMLTLTLSTLGLPLEGVGLLLAIDPVIDMMRTMTNVAGQALVPTIVAKHEGILDEAAYHGDRASDPVGDPALTAA